MLNFLQKLVSETEPERNDNGSSVLTETDEQQTVMKITVQHPSTDVLVLRIPANAHPGAIDNTLGYNKICDYLLFAKESNEVHVYFIELKKTLDLDCDGVPGEACQQILCTVPIFSYLCSMVAIHCKNLPKGKLPKIKQHFVVLGENSGNRINKQFTKPNKQSNVRYYDKHPFKVVYPVDSILLERLK